MSSNDFRPSVWMQRAFGDDCADVAAALTRAATTAQTDGREAKAGSRLPTNEPYGATVWLAFARETVIELEELGAEVVRPKGGRYRVGVINGTLVLSVKLPASTKGVEEMKITSAVRRRILRLAPVHEHATLDFGDDYELTDSGGHVIEDTEFGTAVRAVLVVLEGSARSGVEHLHIGDVRVGDSGEVLWLHHEELPITTVRATSAGLVALDLERPDESFAAGALPQTMLGLVANDGIADNDDLAVSKVDHTGTEGTVNNES
ncbi:hypothetical protein E3T26_12930 [Cryobacterium sp. TMT1-21]|uniref:hypothetical protein n=1 Tax=Cryobacterium sp. TMT1-21 TaxID=1259234 RepID=UPI00106BDA66|nr:hypothetical protein [Cryobacterium sp. TMT1-21]TFD11322.1 hypothetical protein E3T26_12930 [Cryobacterium sp. TMT1-21]